MSLPVIIAGFAPSTAESAETANSILGSDIKEERSNNGRTVEQQSADNK